MRFLLFFLLTSFLAVTAESQDTPAENKRALEIRLGLNSFGPVWKMSRLMIDNDFDGTTSNWFSGGDITHPRRGPAGFTSQISFSQSRREHRSTGFILSYSYLRQVTGYSLVAEWLTVSFSSIYAAFPVFGVEFTGDQEGIELQAGPVLMVNRGRETGTGAHPEYYTRISPGLLAGASAKLWDRNVTYGKFGLQIVSGLPFKMGPFVAEDFWEVSDEIPEAGYWFGHINIVFGIGFNL